MLDVTVGAFPLTPSSARHRAEPLWLPAGVLAVLLTLTMALGASGAEPGAFRPTGQWRPAGAATQQASPDKSFSPRGAVSSLRFVEKSPAGERAPQRAAKPWPSRVDLRVVAVGWNDSEGFGSDGRGSVSVQGVYEKETDADFRLAQSDEPDFGAELDRELEKPFGAEELPPLDGDGMPADSEEGVLPGFEDMMGPDDAQGFSEPGGAEPELEPRRPAVPEPRPMTEPTLPDPTGDGFDDAFENYKRDAAPTEPSGGRNDSAAKQKRISEAEKNCSEELAELKAKVLSTIDISIGVAGEEGTDFPYVCSIDDGTPYLGRNWPQVIYMWKASALCHKPLYFEQVHLERYGHSWGPCLDPVVAGVHFFGTIPALPYCMGLKSPCECVYTLGHYRPGNCAPYLLEQPGFTCRAAAAAAGVWTGGVFLVP